jgi:hypothetical protein
MICKFKKDSADGTKSTGEEIYTVCYIVNLSCQRKGSLLKKKTPRNDRNLNPIPVE